MPDRLVPYPLDEGEPMIQTRGLTKDFVVSSTETVHAVRGIDLDIAPGELVAVLGPNGAGKSTTMRMLTTLIRPTSGTATVAGVDVVADPATVRRHIGYVGQGNGAGHQQRAADELTMQGQVYGLDRAAARRRTARAAGRARPHRAGEAQGVGPVRRSAAAARRRARPGARAAPAVPGRADHRPRPAQPRQPLGAHLPAARRARHDDRAHHALPRRGRHDGRARRGGRPRPGHRRRHRGRAQAHARRRPRGAHGRGRRDGVARGVDRRERCPAPGT